MEKTVYVCDVCSKESYDPSSWWGTYMDEYKRIIVVSASKIARSTTGANYEHLCSHDCLHKMVSRMMDKLTASNVVACLEGGDLKKKVEGVTIGGITLTQEQLRALLSTLSGGIWLY